MFEPWSPVADGVLLPDTFINLLNKGAIAKVPIMVGHVTEEARMFVYEAFTKPISEVEADALVRLIWNGKDVAKRIFKQYPYPEPKPKDYRDWFSVLGTDFVIQCPSRNVSNIFAGHGLPVYWYNYDHAWDVKGLWGPNMTFCEGHACHGGELPFVFNSANKTTAVRLKPAENMLASQMSRAWAAFASTGSPNHNNAGAGPVLSPSWPEHSTASALGYAFRTPGSAVVAHERAPFCDLWDELGYVFN